MHLNLRGFVISKIYLNILNMNIKLQYLYIF